MFRLILLVLYFTYFVTATQSFLEQKGFKQQWAWTICPIVKSNQWVSIIRNDNQHLTIYTVCQALFYRIVCTESLNSLTRPWVKHHYYPLSPFEGEEIEARSNEITPAKITHLRMVELGLVIMNWIHTPGLWPLCDVASLWHTIMGAMSENTWIKPSVLSELGPAILKMRQWVHAAALQELEYI